jgi:hypothetical protein
MSYSQYGEDLIIQEIFGGHTGRLLDIGAWAWDAKSNSRLFLERGWGGVLIEPSPGALRGRDAKPYGLIGAYAERSDVLVVCACVGIQNGLVEIKVTDDAVSSSDPEVQAVWSKDDNVGGYYGWCYYPVITLADIFHQFGGPFDFINIDAEGLSVALLTELMKTQADPRVLCVEHDGKLQEIMTVVSPKGYKARVANADSAGTNVILVRG